MTDIDPRDLKPTDLQSRPESIDTYFSAMMDALTGYPRKHPLFKIIKTGKNDTSAPNAKPLRETPKGSFRQAWDKNLPVEELSVGDHIRHNAIGYQRIIVGVKPHPKGGVQVKTTPAWIIGNRCENPDGKIQKAHLTGRCERWDGKTMVEQGKTL